MVDTTLQQRVDTLLTDSNYSPEFKQAFLNYWNNSPQDIRAFNTALAVAQTKQNSIITTSDSAAQIARDDGTSGVQNPIAPEGRITTSSTNQVTQNLELGTDAPVRTLEQTQSTPGLNINSQPNFGSVSGTGVGINFNTTTGINFNTTTGINPTPFTSPGVGATRDDSVAPNSAGAQQIINASFNQTITPQPNVLDQFPSYTYAISWYLLTPDQFKTLQDTGIKNPASWQLLMQSAGAGTAQADPTTGGRNQYFSLDYYMDNFEIDSLVPLKGTGMAHTATAISFDITEPNGLTLINNLYNAVETTYKNANVASDSINYLMAQYCLAIRFYGYDEQGNLVTKLGKQGTNGNVNLTDPTAVIEKFYPFIIENLTFRLINGQIVYHLKAKPIAQFYNISQDRGTIPAAYNLVGTTVGDILNGKVQASNATAQNDTRPGAPTTNTAPTQPIIAGTAQEADPNLWGSADSIDPNNPNLYGNGT
jgi:hypothetical protein